MRGILKLFLLLAFMAGISVPSPAQLHVHFQRLEVAIWPEYDQPSALVMYRGWLSPDVQLPLTVSLPVPASVESPNAVAKRAPGTNLLVAPYTVEAGESWNMVHLQTDMPEIRLEYYVDLPTGQPQRSFTFEWPGGPEIDNLHYEVMQPLGATDFRVAPSSGPPAVGQDGLTYAREDLGPIPDGGSFFIEFSYTKNTPDLTAAALQPVAPPTQQGQLPSGTGQSPQAPAAQGASPGDSSVWYIVLPIVFAAGLAAGWILLSMKKERSS